MHRRYRYILRFLVRLRREGGSLSLTVPCHVVRRWGLKPGDELLLRSTDQGILLAPRFVPHGALFEKTLDGKRRPLTESPDPGVGPVRTPFD